MNELETTQEATLNLEEDSSVEDFSNALMVIERLLEIGRDFKERWRDKAFARVKKHGSFTVLSREFYVGRPKEWKVKELRKAVEGLFKSTGGDWDAFIDALSTNALKPGAYRKICGPEVFAEHFKDVTVEKLQSKGVEAADELCEVDSRFLR